MDQMKREELAVRALPGRGIADARSMTAALELAQTLAGNRDAAMA